MVLFALQRGIFVPWDCLAVPKVNIELCRCVQYGNTRNQTKKTERNRVIAKPVNFFGTVYLVCGSNF